MTVDPAGAAAHAGYAGQAHYFCSDGGAWQFAADPLAVLTKATDPVRGMPVRVPDAQFTAQRDGVRYFCCRSGCRDHFVAGAAEPAGRPPLRPGGRPRSPSRNPRLMLPLLRAVAADALRCPVVAAPQTLRALDARDGLLTGELTVGETRNLAWIGRVRVKTGHVICRVHWIVRHRAARRAGSHVGRPGEELPETGRLAEPGARPIAATARSMCTGMRGLTSSGTRTSAHQDGYRAVG
jgi:YHS domain-containing protein